MSRLLWSSSRSARMVLIGAAVALILVSVSLLVSTQSTGYYYQWQGEEVVVGFLQSLYNEYPAADDADLLLPGVDKNQAQRPVQHRPHTLAAGTPIPSMSSDLYTNQHPQKQQQDVLNFVIFYADDWTWKTVGFVNNNDAVKTPHIDALARNGVAFTHNCVTSSICWQSRASMVTGVYTSVHQQLNYWDDRMFDTTVAWNQTLYPLLRQAGYHVGLVGKWHAPMPPQYMSSTFDHFKEYYGEHWMDRDGKRRHVTDVNREDALEYLNLIHQQNQKQQREHNRSGEAGMQQKFSLTVGFFATHAWDEQVYPNQYQPQEYSEPMYRNATIPIPASATQEAWDKMPWFFTEDNESRKRWRQRFDTPQHYQVTMKRMYRMASEVDDVVGDVVTKLQDMGVYNHTLLIFTTDNGIFHGGVCPIDGRCSEIQLPPPDKRRSPLCLFFLLPPCGWFCFAAQNMAWPTSGTPTRNPSVFRSSFKTHAHRCMCVARSTTNSH